jgi:hypothetical protein
LRVLCDVQTVMLENEQGREIESIEAVCSRCEWTTQSLGTGESSRLRCLALMREECPEAENNFYLESSELEL